MDPRSQQTWVPSFTIHEETLCLYLKWAGLGPLGVNLLAVHSPLWVVLVSYRWIPLHLIKQSYFSILYTRKSRGINFWFAIYNNMYFLCFDNCQSIPHSSNNKAPQPTTQLTAALFCVMQLLWITTLYVLLALKFPTLNVCLHGFYVYVLATSLMDHFLISADFHQLFNICITLNPSSCRDFPMQDL